MNCTWDGCQLEGVESQLTRDDKEWALLCVEHAAALDQALDSMDHQRVLGAWARAGIGAVVPDGTPVLEPGLVSLDFTYQLEVGLPDT